MKILIIDDNGELLKGETIGTVFGGAYRIDPKTGMKVADYTDIESLISDPNVNPDDLKAIKSLLDKLKQDSKL